MNCHHTPRDEWSWCQPCLYCHELVCDLCYVPHTKTHHHDRLACGESKDVALEPKT